MGILGPLYARSNGGELTLKASVCKPRTFTSGLLKIRLLVSGRKGVNDLIIDFERESGL